MDWGEERALHPVFFLPLEDREKAQERYPSWRFSPWEGSPTWLLSLPVSSFLSQTHCIKRDA